MARSKQLPALIAPCALALAMACASSPTASDQERPVLRVLPTNWRAVPAWDFEQLVSAQPTSGCWSPADRLELDAWMPTDGAESIRSVVLLALGGAPSRELLLAHLETRQLPGERHDDAAEVVAACALGRWSDADTARRLAALAVGSAPHPDLEVRVECGAVALDLGREEVIPFLLRVLHAGTPAELSDPIDWAPTDTLAWAKSRASEALSRRAGLPYGFLPDGPFEHQMVEAARLEAALKAQ